jgi:hypothetical protein
MGNYFPRAFSDKFFSRLFMPTKEMLMTFKKLLSLTATELEIRKGKRLLAIEMSGKEIGCSNGGCIFGHLGGMHTNGACHCSEDQEGMERYVNFLDALGPYFNDSFKNLKRSV